jgi:SAM-dependent methyltransferase
VSESAAPSDPLVVDAWSRVADGYHAYWGPRFRPFLESALDAFSPGPGPLAAVGCGPGDEVLALAARFPERAIVATDPSRSMLELLRARLGDSGAAARVTVREEPATDLPDHVQGAGGVFSSFSLQLLPDRIAALGAWRGALGPDGRIACAFWPRQPEEDAWGHLGRAIEASTGKARPAWEPDVLDGLPAVGLRLAEARDLVHPIRYASPEEAWAQLRDACSLQVLLARAGPEATAACERAWLADHGLTPTADGAWEHRPRARLWLLEPA